MTLYGDHLQRTLAPPAPADWRSFACPVCETEITVPAHCEPPRCDQCSEVMDPA